MTPLTCIAHRGGHLDHADPKRPPENSLEAIRYSLSCGVDAIEIDIWQIEGEILITHDRRLGRQLPGSGLLVEQSLQHLQKLQLSNGEPIPRLIDALELIGNQCLFNIEIKGPDCAAALIKTLRDFSANSNLSLEHIIVSSFDQRQLRQLQQQLPEVKRGVLIAGMPLDNAAQCDPLDAYALHPHIGAIDAELVDDAHSRGRKVWAYTANEEDEWLYLQSIGVDGVFTDYPKKLQLFNQRQMDTLNRSRQAQA